ncbi:Fe-S-containing protein, partial [Pectobacterium brasiliense]|uniref:Fe-S-containing protein n=1 Tax=Pectobacterium brasiliense TaxID=180957 RepID=UPI001F07568B
MDGNKLICVACGVHIFITSIGKSGCCNTLPIEWWSNDDNDLVSGRASVAGGTNSFSTVESMEVIDPVVCSNLTNVSAELKSR